MIPESLAVFLLAVAFDILLGEPPAKVHPVVWIGKFIAFLRARARPTRAGGIALAIAVIAATVLSGHLAVKAAGYVPLLPLLVSAYLFKSTFAIQMSSAGLQRHRADDRQGHGRGKVDAARPGGPRYDLPYPRARPAQR